MDEMDPFEARLLFGNMLDNLTGAQPTIDRVSGFAVKNSSMADNLLDCITEKLEKLAVPPRLNILLVIDAILLSISRTSSRKGRAAGDSEETQNWMDLIKKDIVQLVKEVVPETPGGDGNVPQVRKVVAGWRRKSVFDKKILGDVEKLLANRAGADTGTSTESGMKHQEILKRIEEDRERHKRHKEDAWIRPPNDAPENELESYWETTSDFNDADWFEITAENNEYRHELDLVKTSLGLHESLI
ncbi:hypothetical protein IW140_002974 [Coemansia sp. RSA 1813]|nr:hypothetical protein EV178_003822 [Coemansia sp. RSA 1646]KAJ1770598.1 hypothetical protein LPJ74_003047 [Coemansia sp. RSA 1843]KAJ2091404.1 hypothetical protein IW138_001863 [Coemansia sp. RSA 986]KAJ2212839.1 hypothetical protein EV179_004326 [Coemansia sp. RSA 487]KAJ2569566.1 hypothetical protein IW140_002974 [Coemansia sp. RSA 1813]